MKSSIEQNLIDAIKKIQNIELFYDEFRVRFGNFKKKIVFNLDVHISVVRDIQDFVKNENIRLCNWSISSANSAKNKFFIAPYPVEFVNNETWSNLDYELIKEFNSRYKKFLTKFDGFISCYPPAFNQLYEAYDKPKLVVAATRYEYPYTNRKKDWEELNTKLKNDKNLVLTANNRGDLDYLDYFTGLHADYLPSLCEYIKKKWEPKGEMNLIFSKSKEITNLVEELTEGKWRDVRSVLGRRFSYRDLMTARSVLFIPYNISIMTLFELATAGVPVYVPTRDFLMKLKDNFSNVLNEISFYQVLGINADNSSPGDPNNYNSSDFYNWWLDRADFYDSELMPNVMQIHSFDELTEQKYFNQEELRSKVSARNEKLKFMRRNVLLKFTEKVNV